MAGRGAGVVTVELEGKGERGGNELVTRRDTARTAAAGPGAAAGAVAVPAVAKTVGEAEVRVRRRRLAGPAAGGVAGRGTGGCSEG